MTLTPGKRGTVALRLELRPGADPLLEAAAGQLKESADPYRLVLPAERETLAEYYADELRPLLTESGPAERHLVTAPEVPLRFKAYDGKASFDGTAVSFRWFWTGASSAKWKAGDQRFPVGELSGVEWRSPEVFEGICGCCRGTRGSRRGSPTRTRRRWCSGWGTGPCTSHCRSRRRCWRRCGVVRRWRRWRRRGRGGIRRISRNGSATSGSCTRRAW
ncbi:hypothetical protein SHKM778_75190 [Streptomyces sp. KM77-8]|uniref:DUF4429 domain-containing protein n=1 Tax=Streptomyces haneummycinicus TaxID=3074435 RepID=A0AAT9HV68_9ACTN